jgi:hypothetical protein
MGTSCEPALLPSNSYTGNLPEIASLTPWWIYVEID